MIKQLAMMVTLGLILTVGVAALTTQYLSAMDVRGGWPGGNGINSGQTPPGLTNACGHPNVAQHTNTHNC